MQGTSIQRKYRLHLFVRILTHILQLGTSLGSSKVGVLLVMGCAIQFPQVNTNLSSILFILEEKKKKDLRFQSTNNIGPACLIASTSLHRLRTVLSTLAGRVCGKLVELIL